MRYLSVFIEPEPPTNGCKLIVKGYSIMGTRVEVYVSSVGDTGMNFCLIDPPATVEKQPFPC